MKRTPSLFATAIFIVALVSSLNVHAAPGDIINSFSILNETSDTRVPSTPQGITYHDGHLYVVDFATDRIYRVYPKETYDDQGTLDISDDVLTFNAGDSDLNIPLTDQADPPINSDGNPIGTCGSAIPAGQYCGGGGITYAENFLWNASPITDHINKVDPVDGDNLETENVLASLAFPAPTDITYDGTSFWVVDWQTNRIYKVRPEDGVIIGDIPGPSTLPSYQSDSSVTNARPFGIAWDGQALWISEQEEQRIYRISPTDGSIIDSFATPGTDPKGLTWDGEYLWHVDQASNTIYQIDSGIIPFGIAGCLLKNGKAVDGDVLLSQAGVPDDQATTTDIDGCFSYPNYLAGVPIQVSVNESGVDEKPILTLLGDSEVTLIVGDEYIEENVTVVDAYDDANGLTVNTYASPINTLNSPELIDTSSPTSYIITYNAVDSVGNLADPVTRTINVLLEDTTPPVITLVGNNPMYVEQENPPVAFSEPGATANDDRDGDISGNIAYTGSVDTSTPGTYELSYNVSDANNNAATTVNRTVIVQDTTIPVITLIGSNPINLEKGDSYSESGASAFDNIDENITGSIVISGSVTTATTGSYIISYDVTDSQGNNANTVTRTVSVSDTAAPTITLIGDSSINHELNTTFTDPGATAVDVPSQDLTNSIVVTGSVNSSVAGTYTLRYNVTDPDGNAAPEVSRTVIVADTGAPTITLVGDNPLFHERGTSFNDPGANASDVIDGDISSNIVVTGSVDENTTGSYTLRYNVSDSSGNAASELSRTVNVSDSTPPVITLLGSANINHELQTPYTDAGATASDNTGGDLTSSIIVSGSVDQNTIGIYTITYSVTDSEGNAAAPVSRVIDVADRTAPSLTLNGSNPLNHEVNTVFLDPGATANDLIDGNISSNIGVSGTVDASTVGSYTLYYNVSDTAGNAATTATRIVNVQDTGAPSITMLGVTPLNHELQTPFTDPGATATDAADGDLTSSITVTGSVNENVAGSYTLNYNVSDSQSNPATTQTRIVIVADRTAPVITLTGNATVNVEQGSVYSDAGATANDIIDGNLTSNIITSGTVNTSTPGSYFIRYNVADAAGNSATEVTRTVIVSDTGAPMITLLGSNPFNHEVDTVFVDPGATASDDIDGNLTSSIGVSGSVNANVVGTYTLNYNVTDSSGNAATTVSRTVIVADTGAPSITITGDNPLQHEINTTYNDPGATASDVVDGDLTSSITTTNNVNINAIGSYSVIYNVTDSGGNDALPRTRTVEVNDYTAPIITLTGSSTVNVELNTSYSDAGATANDNYDGNLTSAIVTTGSVDALTAGSYTLNYNVSDAAGNAANTVTRTVIVGDSSAPTITLIGASTISHEQATVYTDPGASASDLIDGDLTSSIIVSGFVNANAAGTYQLNYNVSDSSGNDAATVNRTINVADTIAPVIVRNGSQNINHEINTSYTDAGATASDSVDGDLTSSITTSGSVNTGTLGNYTITYDVSDNAGNAATQVTRSVTVLDTTPPIVTLTDASTIFHEQGTAFTDPGATANDAVDGSVTVTTSGSVNTAVAGTYTLSYDASDLSGNAATTVTRDVIVQDTIAPSITLIGGSTIDHASGSPFVDPGFTATDNNDGDITDDVVVTFVNNVTSYTLSYDVNDAAGNAAPTVQRTVNVVTPTTITIEAETASIVGSHVVATTELGFTGSGYVELKDDGYLEFTIDAYAVPYDLTIRYAMDTGDSPIEVLIEGLSQGSAPLVATGSMGTWGMNSTITITPTSGTGTFRIQPTFAGSGANIDQITLTPQ